MEPNEEGGPEIRLADADREAVVEHLRVAHEEGRITLLEFEDRVQQAYAAVFPSDLAPLTRDLPNLPVAPPTVPAPAPVIVTATPIPRRTRWFVQIMSGGEQRGRWDPGTSTNVITIMGGQDIDLTDVEADVVNLNVFTLMGGTDIIVPRGAQVDMSGFMLFGGTGNEAHEPGESTMRVTVRAFGGMGACDVRHLSDKEMRKRGHDRPR